MGVIMEKKVRKLGLGLVDYGIMTGLVILFMVLTFPRLGSLNVPETTYVMEDPAAKEIIIDLGEPRWVDHLSFFLGREHNIKLAISSFNEVERKWEVLKTDQNIQSVFAWNNVEVGAEIRYLGIVVSNAAAYLNELAIVGAEGQLYTPINQDEYLNLFDEQTLYKAYPTYYDQTFFDEVYHARTAYEYIHHERSYENTHPPLGKILISIGIRLFGMNPFGWRVIVALFGTIMIPLMYLFAKLLLKDSFIAGVTTLLLTTDFMHFTLSKIATLDIIIGFFILLMFYFMYQYCEMDIEKTPLRKSLMPLGLCGITMGLGVATKWTGVYAGLGLAVLFFTHLWQAYNKSGQNKEKVGQKVLKTCAFCVGFFVVIPSIIYCLSYIPFVGDRQYNGLVDKVIDNMQGMYSYHSQLTATHPFQSWWYEWPWMKMPLYQAVTHGPDGRGSAISCFGNPLVWWPGIISVLYTFKCWLWDKDSKARFLSISYSAQLIPWMFITRNTFIYHYFPCSLFMILCSGYSLLKIMKKYKYGKVGIIGYCSMVVIVFILFYPVISGTWVDETWARTYLKWLKDWVII